MDKLERIEWVGRTDAEWHDIVDDIGHWFGFTENESQLGTVSDAADSFLAEIRKRWGEDA